MTKSKTVPTPVKIPTPANRPRCVGCSRVERAEALDAYITVASDGEVVAAVVDEAIALTGQQRGVGDCGEG